MRGALKRGFQTEKKKKNATPSVSASRPSFSFWVPCGAYPLKECDSVLEMFRNVSPSICIAQGLSNSTVMS